MHHGRIRGRTILAALALPFVVAACGTGAPADPEPEHAAVDAHEGARVETGELVVQDAWMPEPANPEVGVVYLSITNGGEVEDALTAVRTNASPKADLHVSETTESGASVMREVEEVPVPAGETTALVKGGFHIMVNDIPEVLEVGDTVVLTLVFENQGEVEVDVPVREMAGDDHEEHSEHH